MGFTGKSYDPKAGLLQFYSRWYDPSVGRFTTQDSYLGELIAPASQHRYAYVLNNPVTKVDRWGYHDPGDPGGTFKSWYSNETQYYYANEQTVTDSSTDRSGDYLITTTVSTVYADKYKVVYTYYNDSLGTHELVDEAAPQYLGRVVESRSTSQTSTYSPLPGTGGGGGQTETPAQRAARMRQEALEAQQNAGWQWSGDSVSGIDPWTVADSIPEGLDFGKKLHGKVRYGFNVEVRGEKAIVQGSPREWIAENFDIQGTRYSMETIGEHTAVGELVDPALAAKSALRGEGVVAGALAVGEDIYDYGWGSHKSTGISSSEFVAAVAVDATIAVSGAVAGAALGAAIGSVVPGVGTVVGALVGWGVGVVVDKITKEWKPVNGQSVRDWAVDELTGALDAGREDVYGLP